MASAWGKIETKPVETMNFAEIMSEEYAQHVQDLEIKRYEKKLTDRKKREKSKNLPLSYSENLKEPKVNQDDDNKKSNNKEENEEWEDYSQLLETKETSSLDQKDGNAKIETLLGILKNDGSDLACDSDMMIAQMLQSQFDQEYNEELRRVEKQHNKQSKVTVTLDNFRRNNLDFLNDSPFDDNDEEEDDDEFQKRDWDRFETNEKILDAIPKCGFKVDKEGEMITKHDGELCGVRNACRIMSFPPEFPTGDGAGFDMKLSNQVYNQLKTFSHRGKKNTMHNRKENLSTAEMGVDQRTRLLLYKLINNQVLEGINGIVSTGKEAVILHAKSDPSFAGNGINEKLKLLPKECAIKIYKTTLNEYKQRDRYIKDDYRFKERFSKQNKDVVINMWAEKEMRNLIRMQTIGINCPDVVVLKKHVLVMSFIGDNHNAAPKLKDARLSTSELSIAYEEIITAMFKLYNEAKLVHADLSEYNILWYDGKCWFIDVSQAVEPGHPSALEFLMRDCANIINFFKKRGLPNLYTKEQLFQHITSLNAETHNVAMLERIHTRGASIKQATAPNQAECPDELKPLAYPFDLAWEKSQLDRLKEKDTISANDDINGSAPIDDESAAAAAAGAGGDDVMKVLNMESCGSVDSVTTINENEQINSSSINITSTAKN